MYRIKVKNKDSGQELLVWEHYDRSKKDYVYYLDLDLKDCIDMSEYEVVEEEEGGIPFNMFGIECGKGWFPLIKPIIDYIDNYNTDKVKIEQIKIMQIKEKFAALEIYVSHGTPELFDMIDNATKESENICEFCGTKENIGSTQGYYMTCCHSCCKDLAKHHGHSYFWHNYNDDNVYLIHPDDDDDLISSISEYKASMP